MNSYAVINLKTDPTLKKQATIVAEKLGISLSAVLNNELRRFAIEQRVEFDLPEVPNVNIQKIMQKSKIEASKGDYHKFDNNADALDFLKSELL